MIWRTLGLLPAIAALLAATPSHAVSPSGPFKDVIDSTVCIQGDTPEGTLTSSGFVAPPGDRILTTAHGLDSATNLRVQLNDGRVFAARLERIGSERADVALLRLVGIRLPPTRLGSVESVSPADEVTTIGCPLGFEFSVTRGVVSAIRPSDLGYPMIQTDVPVNPGSSGGALFDKDGRVVGIIKGKFVKRERIHFALPIDLGIALLERVANEERAFEVFNQAVLEQRPAKKVPLYEQVVALAPEMPEAHHNLALALERLKRKDDAEKHYARALELAPAYEAAALNLGVLLHSSGRYDDAIAAYQRGLGALPRSARIRNNLAEAYRMKGDSKSAIREFERILKERSDYAPAHYGLALVYEDRDRKRAAGHYRQYLKLAPDAEDAARVRDWLQQAEGKL